MARALINVPTTVRRGEIFEIRALISHPMEPGYRVGTSGQLLPRDIVRMFVCRYGEEEVFRAEMFSAVSANPYLAFHVRAIETAPLSFTWAGDNGFLHTETVPLNVV